jgi:hypothetical protein
MEDIGPAVSRRTALKLLGGSGLVVGFGPRLVRIDAIVGGLKAPERLAKLTTSSGTVSPSLQVYAYRREDLLNLQFDLYNLELDTSGATPMLVPISSGTPSWLVAVLPFQSIGEYADLIGAIPPGPGDWPPTPVESLASGPSQLAFTVPSAGIEYTLESLTDWAALSELLPAVAAEDGAAPATDPTGAPTSTTPPLTYVEMDWQLLVAPDAASEWDSPAAPVANGTWTELWQARRTPTVADSSAYVFAVWTPPYPSSSARDPFNMSLSDGTSGSTIGTDGLRVGLVELSSQANSNLPVGTPALAKTLMVTPLGVIADVQGTYSSEESPIISWLHKTSLGRETYVRVVLEGYLYPFGNRAVKIQTTDREFQVSPAGDVVAYLVERITVQVTEPVVHYPYTDPGAAAQPDGGRQNPFVSIEVKTLTTPAIDTSGGSPGVVLTSPSVPDTEAIWINVNGSPFSFDFVGTDAEGRTVDFTAWAIWVVQDPNDQVTNDVLANYNHAAAKWRQPQLNGQLMALGTPSSSQPGATALHVDSLTLDSTTYLANESTTSPPWYLTLSASGAATVRLPAVQALMATDGNDTSGGATVAYETTMYLPDGFPYPAGVPEVFLTFKTSTPPLNFTQGNTTTQSSQTGTSQSGGVVAPNFNIDGFARDKGPVSDSSNLLKGAFDPSTFFAGLDAKILGAIPLSDIIQLVTAGPMEGPDDDGPDARGQTPTVNSVPIYPKGKPAPAPPKALQTTIDWAPTIQSALDDTFQPGDPNGLNIHVVIYAPLDPPGPPSSTIDGELSNFTLELFGSSAGVIAIHFTNVQFSQRTGSKSNVQVNVDTVKFLGALSFIEDFEQLFASLGGPQIDVEPSGITAGYTVSLPSIGLGVFALENISLGGTLTIPFTGQPVRLAVNFCTRENPFLLSIYFFNGGGWFAITLGADGIELVEVGLEFGASISLDLGLASGGVSIEAGIYFALGSDTVTLTGFFQASGNLEVLGIISISIVFYLGLTYQDDAGKSAAYGTASVSVSVSVLFISVSVTLTVTKQIYGSDPPIPFTAAITATDWSDYCASFA